jgi:hypothetical protein
MMPAKSGPSTVSCMSLASCCPAHAHGGYGALNDAGQCAATCARRAPMTTGRMFGTDASAKVELVPEPLIVKNWSTSCERAESQSAWRPASIGFFFAYAAKAASISFSASRIR